MTIEELKQNKQWINWNYVTTKDGKQTKVPIAWNGKLTSANEKDKDTWTTYDNVVKSLKKYNGVGVTFHNGLCGIDIDNKELNDPVVQDVIALMDSYTELSPSKNGIHILFTADVDKIPTIINSKGEKKLDSKYYYKNKSNKIEGYYAGLTTRFFTFTGNIILDKPICERTEQLLIFLDKYMIRDNNISTTKIVKGKSLKTDDEIIAIIRRSNQADKFSMLYDNGDISLYNDDNSSADMGLCCIIAYYTKDFNQIDRIFKSSKLYRDKWEREDYKYSTITKAIQIQENNNNNISDLEYITAKELQEKELPPTIYYVDDILPQGLNLICSVPKMGKSWLALDLCLSICNGTNFLGFKTKQSGCLYLALEDSYNRLKGRMSKLLVEKDAPNNFIYSINCEDLKNGFVKQIESFLNSHKDIKVIIIDTLQKIRSETKNSNAYGHDYKELSMIKRLADERNLCIVLIHHLKKGVTSDPFEKVSGTNGITGTVDTTFVLDKKTRTDEETYLSVVGRDVEFNEYILKFDKDTCKWSMITTVDKYQESYQKDIYQNNTLVDTIKTLLEENNNTWSGTIRSINDKHKELYGYKYLSSEIKLRNSIDEIAPMLMLFDKIKFTPAKSPTNGRRLHTFTIVS